MGKKPSALPPLSAPGKKPGIVERSEALFLGEAEKRNLPFLKAWMLAFFRPEKACESLAAGASLKSAAINLLVFYFAFAAVFFVLAAISYSVSGNAPLPAGAPGQLNPFSYWLQILIIGPVSDTAFMFVSLFLLFVPARLLGGKASYRAQSYMISLLFCGIMSFAAVFILPSFLVLLLTTALSGFSIAGALISVIGPLVALILFAGALGSLAYGLYSLYRMLKKVHQFSGIRAAGAILCTLGLLLVLNLALVMVFKQN